LKPWNKPQSTSTRRGQKRRERRPEQSEETIAAARIDHDQDEFGRAARFAILDRLAQALAFGVGEHHVSPHYRPLAPPPPNDPPPPETEPTADRLKRHVGRAVDGDPDIGGLQRRCIVDPVAYESDNVASMFQRQARVGTQPLGLARTKSCGSFCCNGIEGEPVC
jgi:hypothetical protein